VLPALDGVVERLRAGARVADVGCGAGGAVLLMAEAFPASTFVGYDISQYALDRANERLAESGVTNARFADPRRSRCRPTARSTSSPRSTASTT
jgi:ubiquinone/menaquinone biosynthesis C-methylase UbiE